VRKMNVEVDLDNVRHFILSDGFRDYLINNTTEFTTACFILQTLLDKLDEVSVDE